MVREKKVKSEHFLEIQKCRGKRSFSNTHTCGKFFIIIRYTIQ